MIPAVLRVRDFRRVWLASLASNAGSWLQVVASGWLIFELTDSPAAVGALALVTRAPAFLLSTYGGSLADRFDRRSVGMATFGLQAAAAGTLALITFAGGANLAAIYTLTFAVGVGFALGLPAMLALIPTLVPSPRLSQAVSLNAAGINVARLAGPGHRRRGARALRRHGVLRPQRRLVPGAGVGAVAHPAAPARRRARAAGAPGRRSTTRGATRPRAACCWAWALFTALASPIQELAPVVAARLDAGPEGPGAAARGHGRRRARGRLAAGAPPRPRAAAPPRPAHLHDRLLGRARRRGGHALAGRRARSAWPSAARSGSGMFAATNTAIQLRAPLPLLGRMLGLYQLAVIGPIAIGSSLAGAGRPGRRDRGDPARLRGAAGRCGASGACATPSPRSTPGAGQSTKAAIASSVRSGIRPSTCRKWPAPGTRRVGWQARRSGRARAASCPTPAPCGRRCREPAAPAAGRPRPQRVAPGGAPRRARSRAAAGAVPETRGSRPSAARADRVTTR